VLVALVRERVGVGVVGFIDCIAAILACVVVSGASVVVTGNVCIVPSASSIMSYATVVSNSNITTSRERRSK